MKKDTVDNIQENNQAPSHSPQLMMMRSIGAMISPLIIKSALDLGVFEVINNGISCTHDIAKHLQLNPSALQRLMRAMVSIGLLTSDPKDSYTLTDLGRTLLPGSAPESMEALARYLLDESTIIPMMNLGESVRTGRPSLKQDEKAGWYNEYPKRALLMDKAMAVYSKLSLPALLASYDFSKVKVLMDVAGGVGQMIADILKANPGLKGILFDIPETVKRADNYIQSQGMEDRCEIISGDMFTRIPDNADLYLLSKVLNNWDDQHVSSLLKNIRLAMSKNAKLIIVENMASNTNPSMEEVFRDLMFLACSNGGKVRTETEFRELITGAGLECTQIIPTPSAFSIIECKCVID